MIAVCEKERTLLSTRAIKGSVASNYSYFLTFIHHARPLQEQRSTTVPLQALSQLSHVNGTAQQLTRHHQVTSDTLTPLNLCLTLQLVAVFFLLVTWDTNETSILHTGDFDPCWPIYRSLGLPDQTERPKIYSKYSGSTLPPLFWSS